MKNSKRELIFTLDRIDRYYESREWFLESAENFKLKLFSFRKFFIIVADRYIFHIKLKNHRHNIKDIVAILDIET